jgi:hypothetical protein
LESGECKTYVHNHPLMLGTSSRWTVTDSAAKEKFRMLHCYWSDYRRRWQDMLARNSAFHCQTGSKHCNCTIFFSNLNNRMVFSVLHFVQCSRGDHIILELRPSIICLPIQRTFSRLKNNSNKHWKNFYISTHFTA